MQHERETRRERERERGGERGGEAETAHRFGSVLVMVMVIYTALPSPVPPIYLCPPIYLTPAPTTSQPAIIDGGRAEPDAAPSASQ